MKYANELRETNRIKKNIARKIRKILTSLDSFNLEEIEQIESVFFNVTSGHKLCMVEDLNIGKKNGMKIETQLFLGQKVFVIHDDSTYKKQVCPTCGGEGYVMICSLFDNFETGNHPTISCPECHGTKMIYGEKINRYTMEETTIKGIKISVTEQLSESRIKQARVHVSYMVKADNPQGELSYPEHENMIFASKQSAYDKCKELNNKNDG